ncbi:hypothetical protein BDN72DRAFT_864957 [Pluteus cervinus]|uniref:Uncharacterized protein n=1 Tax=Pluteus cervinus TaxID=181527 RepID=A0ACD3A1U9_9AGAR|nr:hypothetical protein BDN72DRAFT_864957 [Pluteus cervinus]
MPTIFIKNFEEIDWDKVHARSCLKTIAKKEKMEREKLKDGSLLPFFRTQTAKIPSTVKAPAPVHGDPVTHKVGGVSIACINPTRGGKQWVCESVSPPVHR